MCACTCVYVTNQLKKGTTLCYIRFLLYYYYYYTCTYGQYPSPICTCFQTFSVGHLNMPSNTKNNVDDNLVVKN